MTKSHDISLDDFCSDAQLIGEPLSRSWSTFFRAIEGLPLDEEGQDLFKRCTGREVYEPHAYSESLVVAGRRSEKTSSFLKYLLWKIATFDRATGSSRSELLRVPVIAQDLRIAKDLKTTAESYVRRSAILSRSVGEFLTNEIKFKNGIALTCYPATWRSTRGLSVPFCLLDELAFVEVEGASQVELVRQVKPAMIRFGEARRLCKATTPWRSTDHVAEEFSRRSEHPEKLVWQAATWVMTDRVDRKLLEEERRADPSYFAREYEALFTADSEAFIPLGDIEAAVIAGRSELQPAQRLKGGYLAAIDASSLTGRDRFVFGIAHRAVRGSAAGVGPTIDLLRGWTRSPVPQVCDEISALAKAYGIRTIVADQHGYAFLRELMSSRGIELRQLPFTTRSKPEIFLDLKLALAQGRVQLLDHPEALRELRMLESKRTSGGNYSIAAPRGAHDDYACCLALLAHETKHEDAGGWGFLVVSGQGGALQPAKTWLK
jgi:hypothetical protein